MKNQKGFTLIEILVALTLFSVIVAIAVGGFARAIRAQKEAASLIALQSDAGSTLEEMAREMRTGYLFCTTPSSTVPGAPGGGGPIPWSGGSTPDCVSSCTTSGGGTTEPWTCTGFLHFYDSYGNDVSYSLSNGAILRNGSQLTSSDVRVDSLIFTLYGQLLGDGWNPRVTISMSLSPNTTDASIASDTVNLETTVSARDADSYGTAGY